MSDTESDASLDTEELNEIKDSIKETFEEVEVKGIEREPIKKKVKKLTKEEKKEIEPQYENEIEEKEENNEVVVVEKKKRVMTDKQKEALKAGRDKANLNKKNKKVEKLNKNIKDLEEVEYTKKVKGRPKTKEIIKTEKIIYMIPNKETGEYERITNPPKLTAKDLKKIEVEKKAREQEMEMGKKLTRKKNGQIDKRSSRTLNNGRSEAQINATKKMLEKNKQLREARKNTKTEETTKIMKKEIKESIVEVVSQPAEEVKKKRERSEEQIKKDNLRKAISMFS
jgi:hypothetical protein|tara:strand:+ start:2409 stop:3257 length:849 start_codon:yes stop_codon:yes gene_type:complete